MSFIEFSFTFVFSSIMSNRRHLATPPTTAMFVDPLKRKIVEVRQSLMEREDREIEAEVDDVLCTPSGKLKKLGPRNQAKAEVLREDFVSRLKKRGRREEEHALETHLGRLESFIKRCKLQKLKKKSIKRKR